MSATGDALPLPPSVPQYPPAPIRTLARWLLDRAGWRLVGRLPDLPRVILVAAPHSSWWDGVWGLFFKVALGLDAKFMGKRELFRGPLGWLLRRMGGVPIERSAAHGLVDQMVARFAEHPRLWLGITPEGTRKRVAQWKTGFWHIARAAHVPILPIAFDYPTRTITIGTPFEASDDVDADIAALRRFYAPFHGRNRDVEAS